MRPHEIVRLFAEEEIMRIIQTAKKPLPFLELERRVAERIQRRGAPMRMDDTSEVKMKSGAY